MAGVWAAILSSLRESSVLHLAGLDPAFIPMEVGGGAVKLSLIDGEQLMMGPGSVDRKSEGVGIW